MEQLSPFDPNYCYTVKELAFAWNMSSESIRRLFIREPGTLIFVFQRTGQRTYQKRPDSGPHRLAGTKPHGSHRVIGLPADKKGNSLRM